MRWSEILLLQVLKKGYPNLGISNRAIQCKMHKQQTHELVWHLTVPYSARCTNNRLMSWSDLLLLQVLKKGYPNLGISNRAIQCKMHKQQTHEMVWHLTVPYSARCTNNRLMSWSDLLLLQVLKKGYPNLVYLTVPYSARCTNNRLMRWADIFQQFIFTVQYRKGVANTNADALSGMEFG